MDLSNEIKELGKKIIILKGLNARNGEWGPIKLSKNQTSLKLITERGSDWLFEDIIFGLNEPLGTFKCNITSRPFFSRKLSFDGVVNDDLEIMFIKIHSNSGDTFTWSDKTNVILDIFMTVFLTPIE